MAQTVEVDQLRWGDVYLDANGREAKHYPLHEHQGKVFNSNARFTAAIAGTGGGKTVLGPLWLAKKIGEFREKNKARRTPFLGMVLAPTYKVLSRATVPALIDTFNRTNLQGVFKQSDNVYVLPDIAPGFPGGKLWCQGVDSPGGIEGGQFDAIWGDEAGQFKRTAWIAMQGRTGQKQAPILLTTTPYGYNFLYEDVYKRYAEGDKDYFVVQWASIANPSYPIEEYNRAKASMGAERAAQRYDGQFVKLEGLVYGDFNRCVVDLTDDQISNLLQQDGKHFGGIDFGWNDPFVALAGFLDAFDVLWVWFCRYKSQTPMEEHAAKLPKIYGRTITWACDHDPERVNMIRKLRKGSHKAVPAKKGILIGIDAVNARINSGRLKVLANQCRPLIREAQSYHYPEKDEVIIGDKPEPNQDDHAMDALRYLVMQIDGKKAS